MASEVERSAGGVASVLKGRASGHRYSLDDDEKQLPVSISGDLPPLKFKSPSLPRDSPSLDGWSPQSWRTRLSASESPQQQRPVSPVATVLAAKASPIALGTGGSIDNKQTPHPSVGSPGQSRAFVPPGTELRPVKGKRGRGRGRGRRSRSRGGGRARPSHTAQRAEDERQRALEIARREEGWDNGMYLGDAVGSVSMAVGRNSNASRPLPVADEKAREVLLQQPLASLAAPAKPLPRAPQVLQRRVRPAVDTHMPAVIMSKLGGGKRSRSRSRGGRRARGGASAANARLQNARSRSQTFDPNAVTAGQLAAKARVRRALRRSRTSDQMAASDSDRLSSASQSSRGSTGRARDVTSISRSASMELRALIKRHSRDSPNLGGLASEQQWPHLSALGSVLGGTLGKANLSPPRLKASTGDKQVEAPTPVELPDPAMSFRSDHSAPSTPLGHMSGSGAFASPLRQQRKETGFGTPHHDRPSSAHADIGRAAPKFGPIAATERPSQPSVDMVPPIDVSGPASPSVRDSPNASSETTELRKIVQSLTTQLSALRQSHEELWVAHKQLQSEVEELRAVRAPRLASPLPTSPDTVHSRVPDKHINGAGSMLAGSLTLSATGDLPDLYK